MPPKTKLQAEAEAEGFDFRQWILDHLKQIVFVCAVLVIAGVGLLLFMTLKVKDRDQHWTDLISTALYGSPFGADDVYKDIEQKASGDVVAHAMLHEAIRLKNEQKFDEALVVLARLDAEFPELYLTKLPSPDIRFPVTGAIRRWIEVERDWDAQHGYEEPELNTDRVALVETSMGAFWLGFYPELAPEHVENFLALAKSGALNGTSVTSITGNYFQFGGDASKDLDPMNDAPEVEDSVIEPGPGRFKARQERGTISTVAVDGGEAGTRFDVVTGERAFDLEKRQTVFGRVLNDKHPMSITLDEIKNAITYAKSPSEEIKANPEYLKIGDHPVEFIRIERVTVWSGDKIEDGHEFDVSEVVMPVAEENPADTGKTDEDMGGETTTDQPEDE